MYLEPLNADPIPKLWEMLSKDGYRPTQTDRDFLNVKIEGGLYLISHDGKDPGFYQLAYPNLWVENDSVNIWNVLNACNYANSQSKLAKCYEDHNSVHCVINVLADNPDDFYKNFSRYISAIKYAVGCFYKKLKDSSAQDTHG